MTEILKYGDQVRVIGREVLIGYVEEINHNGYVIVNIDGCETQILKQHLVKYQRSTTYDVIL